MGDLPLSVSVSLYLSYKLKKKNLEVLLKMDLEPVSDSRGITTLLAKTSG